MRGLPSVAAPMNGCVGLNCNAQSLSRWHAAALVVEAPLPVHRPALLHAVTLHGLRRLIENLAVFERTHQLDVLRMRPHQRARRTGGFAEKKFARGDVGGVPDLFGQEAA